MHQARLEGGYNLSDKQSLTAVAGFNTFNRTMAFQFRNRFLDQNRSLHADVSHANRYSMWQYSLETNLGYLLKFEEQGHQLALDGMYSTTPSAERYLFGEKGDDWNSQQFPLHRKVWDDSQQGMVQANYTQPVGKNHKLEAGYKSNWRRIGAKQQWQEVGEHDWQPSGGFSNSDALYDELVNAAYAEYSHKQQDWSYQLSLRAEQTLVKAEQQEQLMGKNYLDLFPSLSLSRQLGGNNSLSLSYSQRITRPQSWQLYALVEYINEQSLRFGNPDLLPEKTNALELNHQSTGTKALSIQYSFCAT